MDNLVSLSRTTKIELVGYSGGAAIAIGVAAARRDVTSRRTIAGNLDPAGVNRAHGVTPMPTAIDTVALATKIANVAQRHLIGSNDTIVLLKATRAFFDAMPAKSCSRKTVVEGADHRNGWVKQWPQLLKVPLC